MTTINTIEDLIKLLDENPEWLEALRSRLLTRELLELPQKFAEFVAATNKRFDAIESRLDKNDGRLDGIDGRLDGIDGRLDGIDGRLDKGESRLDRIESRLDGIDVRLDRLENGLQALRNDLGPIKGAHARNAAIEQTDELVYAMGLRRVGRLVRSDLFALTIESDTTGIPNNELVSFRGADLVVDAVDRDGVPCYIAVEVSFTVNGRDTSRAIRNAALLTQFTGRPAHAAVVGINRDSRVDDLITSGEVFWHQLELDDLESE